MENRFRSFAEFYPFYIGEHSRPLTKIFHFLGTGTFIGCVVMAIVDSRAIYIPAGIVTAYGMAWISHFFIEKNRPATFKYPLYSLIADFRLFVELLFFKRRFF